METIELVKKCHICERTNRDLDYNDLDNNEICSECFDDNFFICQLCEEQHNNNDSVEVYSQGLSELVCNDCSQGYEECSNCGHLVHEDDGSRTPSGMLCYICVRESLLTQPTASVNKPHLDTEITTFQDNKKGEIITDKRMFSTEIECYYPNNESYAKVLKIVTKNFAGTGQVGDGSLDSQGIEFQTPILKGAKGEKYIRDFSKLLIDNKFFVNTKAGTHIHLDGEGFTPKSLFTDEELIKIRASYLFKIKSNSSDFAYYINILRQYIRYGDEFNTTKYQNGELESVNDLMTAVYKGTEDQQEQSKETDKLYIKNKKNKEFCIKQANSCILALLQRLDGDKYLNYQTYYSQKISYKLLPALKKLFTIYYFADDFIMQVLPHSRRNNKYCLPLWKEFNISNIDQLESLEEFEKMWYRMDDLHHIISKKRDPKDSTRRHGANFHILMCQGHFELRYHSGTINADKILYWVALNQALMKLATVGYGQFDEIRQELENIRFIQNLKLRRQRMYNLLGLPKDAIAYWESRANKFTDENELAPIVERVGNNQDL